MNDEEQNRHLSGNYAPVHKELDLSNLEVIGTLPKSLYGTYYCIGSNPQFDPIGDYHWFTGDGMVHAITINLQGASYRNRWVRTDKFTAERKLGQAIFDGMDRRINNDPQYDRCAPWRAKRRGVFRGRLGFFAERKRLQKIFTRRRVS